MNRVAFAKGGLGKASSSEAFRTRTVGDKDSKSPPVTRIPDKTLVAIKEVIRKASEKKK